MDTDIRAAFGSEQLHDEAVHLCEDIIREHDITADNLYDKWESYAMARSLPARAPTSLELKQLHREMNVRLESARKKKEKLGTPRTDRRRRLPKEMIRKVTPVREVTVDDFFGYLGEGVVFGEEEEGEGSDGDGEGVVEGERGSEGFKTPERVGGKEGGGEREGSPERVLGSEVGSWGIVGDEVEDVEYGQRRDVGRVEASWNGGIGMDGLVEGDVEVEVLKQYGKVDPDRPFRYMNEELYDKADVLRERVRRVGKAIVENIRKLGKEDVVVNPQNFYTPTTQVVFALGRIRCELDETDGTGGRINLTSVLLESEEGTLVKLDLSRLAKQALFIVPGMIVVVEGMNTNGRLIEVHAIYDNAMSKDHNSNTEQMEDVDEKSETAAKVLIATGPYTTNSNLKFEPLDDLLAIVKRNKPRVTILTGPFLPENHPLISSDKAVPVEYERVFETRIVERLEAISETHFAILPALEDIHHEFVAPQPPFQTLTAAGNITFGGNPSIVRISSKTSTHQAHIGITSLPTLTDMSADCICLGKSDRFAALASHVLRQRSFYPICPASSNVPLDTTFESRIQIPLSLDLDVLVLPSKLKTFVKEVDGGGICVNPGYLCKGKGGGTFCELKLPLRKKESRTTEPASNLIQAEICRI